MTFLRRHAMLLLTLVMGLVLALSPAMAANYTDYTIEEMGAALLEKQTAYDAANDAYDALCETIEELNERYENGSEAEQIAVQDTLLEAMIEEESAYVALNECRSELEGLLFLHTEMLEASGIEPQELSAKGYDSKLTILVWLDENDVIWNITVEVDGNKQDKAVSEGSFLTQFIGRQLPLSTDKKDEDCIIFLADAKKTSQAVVDAVNTLAQENRQADNEPDGPIIEPQDIADYIFEHGELPPNFITKKEAQNLGWDSSYNYVSDVAPGYSIGGDRFGNYEGLLPDKKGRQWYEADCYYTSGKRNAHRILFSNDGLVYYTDDHYESFTQMFPSGK